jgi:hypothetical protein
MVPSIYYAIRKCYRANIEKHVDSIVLAPYNININKAGAPLLSTHAAHPEVSPKAAQEIIHLDGQAKQVTRKEKAMTTRDIESKAKTSYEKSRGIGEKY